MIGALLAQAEVGGQLLHELAGHGILGLIAAIAIVGYVWERRENRRLVALVIEKAEEITKANLESAQSLRTLTDWLKERYSRRGG